MAEQAKTMRIGQVSEVMSVKYGGTATAFMGTLVAVRTRPEIQITAYSSTPEGDDPSRADVDAHPEEWRLSTGNGHGGSGAGLRQAAVADVRAGRLDVVHIHGIWSRNLLAIARACRDARVPCVWQVHGMLLHEAIAQKRWKKELFLALGLRNGLRNAAALLFVTEHERDHSRIPSGIPPQRLAVIPLAAQPPAVPIDPAFRAGARKRFALPDNAPVIVFMGRLHPVKRIEMTLAALARLPGDLADTRLLIVGGGEADYVDQLKRRAAALGLADRVIFAGWLQGEDKWKSLAAADVLALNSVHENFGFVAVEALCAGTTPVLTSNLALAEELSAAGLAQVAEPDERALAAALARALSTRDAGRVLAFGPPWVQANFSPPAIGSRLAELYHRVRTLPANA